MDIDELMYKSSELIKRTGHLSLDRINTDPEFFRTVKNGLRVEGEDLFIDFESQGNIQTHGLISLLIKNELSNVLGVSEFNWSGTCLTDYIVFDIEYGFELDCFYIRIWDYIARRDRLMYNTLSQGWKIA